jgi:hypothetical protein
VRAACEGSGGCRLERGAIGGVGEAGWTRFVCGLDGAELDGGR